MEKEKNTNEKSSKKIIIITSIVAIVAILFVSFGLLGSRTYSWFQSTIDATGDNFLVKGIVKEEDKTSAVLISKITFSPEEKDLELVAKEAQIFIYSNDEIIYTSEKITKDQVEPINNLLENTSIEIKKANKEIDLKNMKLTIETEDINDEKNSYNIDISIY